MKPNNTITLSAEHFLNEILWPATRYCIGRQSYVTSYAEGYWHIIRQNLDKFDPDRLCFFAADIRAYISDCVSYYDNVHVENAYNDRIRYDAFSLLYKYIEAIPLEERTDETYTVDCLSGEVTAEPFKPKDYPIRFGHKERLYDLLPWVRLANCIDRRYRVTCSHDGKTDTRECFEDIDGKFICADRWTSSPTEEWITKVEEVEI